MKIASKTVSILSVLFLISQSMAAPGAFAFGDAPSTLYAKADEHQSFPIKIIPEECFFTPEFYEQLKVGVYFLYSFMRERFDLQFDSKMEFKLHLFGSQSSYQVYQQSVSASQSDYGFYMPQTNEAVILVLGTEKETLETVLHETTHAFLRHAIPYIPRWVNEGLAEYFQGMMIQGDKVILVPHWNADYAVKQMLQEKSMLNLVGYFQITDHWEDYYRAKPTLSGPYGMGWSIVAFLMSTAEGMDALRKTLEYLKENPKESGASAQGLAMYYPGGLDALEKNWYEWIPKQRSAVTVDFNQIAYQILNA